MKAVLVVLLGAPSFSQTTWSGLHFGMTPEQAHVALKDRPNKDRLEPAIRIGSGAFSETVPETFWIDVQDATVGQHKGVAHIRFDKGRKARSSQPRLLPILGNGSGLL